MQPDLLELYKSFCLNISSSTSNMSGNMLLVLILATILHTMEALCYFYNKPVGCG